MPACAPLQPMQRQTPLVWPMLVTSLHHCWCMVSNQSISEMRCIRGMLYGIILSAGKMSSMEPGLCWVQGKRSGMTIDGQIQRRDSSSSTFACSRPPSPWSTLSSIASSTAGDDLALIHAGSSDGLPESHMHVTAIAHWSTVQKQWQRHAACM